MKKYLVKTQSEKQSTKALKFESDTFVAPKMKMKLATFGIPKMV